MEMNIELIVKRLLEPTEYRVKVLEKENEKAVEIIRKLLKEASEASFEASLQPLESSNAQCFIILCAKSKKRWFLPQSSLLDANVAIDGTGLLNFASSTGVIQVRLTCPQKPGMLMSVINNMMRGEIQTIPPRLAKTKEGPAAEVQAEVVELGMQ